MGTGSQGRRWTQGLFSVVLVFLLSSLTACKTETSKTTTHYNSGWITIEAPNAADTYSIDLSSDTLELSGRSFYGDAWRCKVVMGLFSCETGVSITWKNLTTGQSGTGTSYPKYCWLFQYYLCGATWVASPTVALGTNKIEVTAASGSDFGTDTITIIRTDSQPPRITSISPADGSTGVATDTTIVVNFNESIKTSTITSYNFRLVDADGNSVNGTFAPASSFFTFTPDSPLTHSTSYTITTGAGIQDIAGNRINTDTTVTFATLDRTWSSFNMTTNGLAGVKSVWTGTKMITWGGDNVFNIQVGYVYDPTDDSSFRVASIDAPQGTMGTATVWSGSEMIAWGGYAPVCSGTCTDVYYDTGGRYDPETNTWAPTSAVNAPSPRAYHTALWTGNKLIVWGGQDASGNGLNTGGLYDPATDTWTAISTTNAPTARYNHTAVWTGTEMIIWGGHGALNDGARYNPTTDTWTPVSTTSAPFAREGHAAVWTGSEMIVWGSSSVTGTSGGTTTGGKYNPTTDSWTPTSTVNAPSQRSGFSATWTGSDLVIWGGQIVTRVELSPGSFTIARVYFDTIELYNPVTNTWKTFPTQNTPAGRYRHAAAWTGTQLVIMGGLIDDGSVYTDTDVLTYTGGKLTLYP